MRKTPPGTTTLEQLAQLITSISSKDISTSAKNAARLAVIDVLGVAAAGTKESAPLATSTWAQATFSKGHATIWFAGQKGNTLAATIANSAAACAMDGDDTHWHSWMHSGSAIVPAAFAAAEEANATWDEVLEAIVIGYEVTCRIAQSVDWPVMKQIATGHWCGFGAAAAVGRLRGLSAYGLSQALGVVVGLRPYVYSPDDELNLNGIKEGISWGTFAGISSLELSQLGLTGPVHGLDHELFDRNIIVRPLDGRWAIEEVSIKPYASCAWPHASVEALVSIMSDHSLTARDIDSITVTTFPQAVTYINNEPDPATLEGAQYNIPFNIAVAAFDGEAGLLPLQRSTLHRPELVELATRVELIGDVEYEKELPFKHPVTVKVSSSRGTFEKFLPSETNPHNLSMVEKKFRAVSSSVLSRSVQDQIIELVMKSSDGFSPLCDLLFSRLGRHNDDAATIESAASR